MTLYRLKYHHECWSNPVELAKDSRITFENIFPYSKNLLAGFFRVDGSGAEQKKVTNLIRLGQGVKTLRRKGNEYFIVVKDDFTAYNNFFHNKCIPFPNISINSGIEEMKIFGFSKRSLDKSIKAFGEKLDGFKIIEKIDLPEDEFKLTFKEKEAFDLAVKRGYFKVPRKATLEELASELGIKKSALAERLRKAEIKVVNAYSLRY